MEAELFYDKHLKAPTKNQSGTLVEYEHIDCEDGRKGPFSASKSCFKKHIIRRSSMAAVLVGFTVVLCLAVKTYAIDDAEDEDHRPEVTIYKSLSWENSQVPSRLSEYNDVQQGIHLQSSKDWNYLQKYMATFPHSLHVKVREQHYQKGIISKLDFEANSLDIHGNPSFCTEREPNVHAIVENMRFENVTFLHLSDMENCHFYGDLILSKWNFPNVRHLKLERMLIREKEFRTLSNFIDKYNETLYHVEINECYLCPSPTCDAGMINFPEHDFRLSIKRRRESPEWI